MLLSTAPGNECNHDAINGRAGPVSAVGSVSRHACGSTLVRFLGPAPVVSYTGERMNIEYWLTA